MMVSKSANIAKCVAAPKLAKSFVTRNCNWEGSLEVLLLFMSIPIASLKWLLGALVDLSQTVMTVGGIVLN